MRIPDLGRTIANLNDELQRSIHALTGATPQARSFQTTIFGAGTDTMPFLRQEGNGCGTTSLAMIVSYLKGHPYSQSDIDHQIRRTNVFSAPGDLVQYARDQGLNAEMYNHGTVDELKSFIDRGIPCQVLISNDGSAGFGKLHYVAVVGYERDDKGNEYIKLHDPNKPYPFKLPLEDFKKRWEAPPGGFDNFFIAYAPRGTSLPPGRDDGIEGTLTASKGVANFMNGADRIGHLTESPGTAFRGLFQVNAGLGQILGGATYGGLQLGADWVHRKVDGVPVARNVVQPIADIYSGAGAMGSDLVNGVSEGVADLGQGLEKLGKGDVVGFGKEAGASVVDTGKGVGHAIADGVGKGVSAVKDVFSGW